MDVLRGGLRHLRGEAVDTEHVVVRAVRLQAVGQLRGGGSGGDHLERDDVALAVRRVLRGTHVVGEAEPVLLGLAREPEAPQLAVDVARVVHDHRVTVRERRPVSVHGLEAQPSLTRRLLHRALQPGFELGPQQLIPSTGIADAAELPAHLEERVAIDERVHVPDGDVAQHARTPERHGGDGRVATDRAPSRHRGGASSPRRCGARASRARVRGARAPPRAHASTARRGDPGRAADPRCRALRRRPCSSRRRADRTPRRSTPGRADRTCG